MVQFLFHFMGISDFQCVARLPGFLSTLQSSLLSQVEVGIFFPSENNVRMVTVKRFKQVNGLISLLFGETFITILIIEW